MEMKYAVLIGDGMADNPIPELGHRTPLEAAATPNMDRMARTGPCGLVRTVPAGVHPGSDTANLSIFGYNPAVIYTGRAPLEALNMGIAMGPRDVAFRCNMVEVRDGVMNDFSAGHIDTAFSRIVMEELAAALPLPGIEFHPGVSYRNIVLWRDFPSDDVASSTPPHDIQDRETVPHLPRGSGAERLIEIMARSREIIASSARIREARGRLPGTPTQVWLWGGGRKPAIPSLPDRFGLHGYTISAVDLIHGIGRAAGLEPLTVPGATGYLDTNYEGKAAALLDGLTRANFVFLHVESPDESGHEGNLAHKLQAIEDFDRRVVGPVLDGLSRFPAWTAMVLPDHPTPLALRTHTADPVPFAIVSTAGWENPALAGRSAAAYSERDAAATGLRVEEGYRLVELMIHRTI